MALVQRRFPQLPIDLSPLARLFVPISGNEANKPASPIMLPSSAESDGWVRHDLSSGNDMRTLSPMFDPDQRNSFSL